MDATTEPMATGTVPLKRGDLTGWAAGTYIPRRGGRAARHYADGFSSALWAAKIMPDVGREWAYDLGRLVADLLPDGVTTVVNPPPSRQNRGWHLARGLAQGVVTILRGRGRAVRLGRELRWEKPAGEASKALMSQRGKGRGLGRVCIVDEEVAGECVAIVDDLTTTGCTAAVVAEALLAAGATVAGVYCLGATERTEARPAHERDHLQQRREIGALRRNARGGATRPA